MMREEVRSADIGECRGGGYHATTLRRRGASKTLAERETGDPPAEKG